MKALYVGLQLLYRLSESDAEQINRRRTDGGSIHQRMTSDPPTWPEGAQAHIGNAAHAGDVYPLIVTRVWDHYLVNGQVLLDGNDALWVTSVHKQAEDGEKGVWFRPSESPSTPAIGAIVHFRRGTRDPLPAIITKVHDEKTVDLTVFTGNPTAPVWVRQREKLIDPATDVETGWYARC